MGSKSVRDPTLVQLSTQYSEMILKDSILETKIIELKQEKRKETDNKGKIDIQLITRSGNT